MNLERFLRETKEKHKMLIANGEPKELFVIIDCEVFINVSKR